MGHYSSKCWALGRGAKGKGPKQKGKGKEKDVAAKVEEKDTDDDGVWMAKVNVDKEVQESIEVSDEMWSTNEISTDYDVWAEHSPDISILVEEDIITNCSNFHDFLENKDVKVNDEGDTAVEEFMCEGLEEEITTDNGEEAKTYTFAAITLAGTNSTIEMELYDSGMSHHMLPYQYKFINFITIQKKLLTTADGSHFEAIGKGDMHIMMPNCQTTTQILLKDVLYVPKMGVTLISIGKIDTAGYVALFHRNQLRIFSVMKGRRVLAQILIKNGLYCVQHVKEVDIAAVVVPEVVTVEKLHWLMGHIAPEAAKALVTKGLIKGFKLDKSSKMPSTCSSCEYGKAHRKLIGKEHEAPRAEKIGDEIHLDVWGLSPVQTISRMEYYSTYIDACSRYLKLYLQKLKSKTYHMI